MRVKAFCDIRMGHAFRKRLANVPDGDVKVLDFGLAQRPREGVPGEVTRRDEIVGTPGWPHGNSNPSTVAKIPAPTPQTR